jgi:hypothetical protein
MHLYRSYIRGHKSFRTDMVYALSLTNTAGISDVICQIFDNTFQEQRTSILVTPAYTGGNPASIEGCIFRDKILISNEIGIDIDASGAGYQPPGFFIVGNQFESYTTPVILNNISQYWLKDNVVYTHSASNTAISVSNSLEGHVSGNFVIGLNPGKQTAAPAETFIGSSSIFNTISEEIIANFTTGISFGPGTSSNTLMPNVYATVTTSTSNNGSNNLILDSSATAGFAFPDGFSGKHGPAAHQTREQAEKQTYSRKKRPKHRGETAARS